MDGLRKRDDVRGRLEELLALHVLVGVPRKAPSCIRIGKQGEGVKHVDGEVSQRATAGRSRLDESRPRQRAQLVEPRTKDVGRVGSEASARCSHGRRQPERRGELGHVEDRHCFAVDDERRDDRATGLAPAALTLGPVADVERVERHRVLAKELPGRGAARSGRMPVERERGHQPSSSSSTIRSDGSAPTSRISSTPRGTSVSAR